MIEGAEEVQVSIATQWEMAIKVGAGKWPDAVRLLEAFDVAVAEEGFQLLPIALPHVRRAGLMISANRDPFDRLLVAQALTEGLVLVSSDPRMGEMGANLVW
jgi:PIN domain nuclease of toxin-antitoxin system